MVLNIFHHLAWSHPEPRIREALSQASVPLWAPCSAYLSRYGPTLLPPWETLSCVSSSLDPMKPTPSIDVHDIL